MVTKYDPRSILNKNMIKNPIDPFQPPWVSHRAFRHVSLLLGL